MEAAGQWRVGVVELLFSKEGINLDAQDLLGRTALGRLLSGERRKWLDYSWQLAQIPG